MVRHGSGAHSAKRRAQKGGAACGGNFDSPQTPNGLGAFVPYMEYESIVILPTFFFFQWIPLGNFISFLGRPRKETKQYPEGHRRKESAAQ